MQIAASSGAPSGKAKRRWNIEKALQWAFREELPKVRAERPLSKAPTMAMHPMWRAGAFGSRIDNWNNIDPGFPAAMGEPHPDAVLIGNAVRGCDVDKLDFWGFLIPYKIGENFDQIGIMEKARRETVAVMTNCATSRTRPDTSDRIQVEPVRAVNGQITVWLEQDIVDEDVNGNQIVVKAVLPTGTLGKKKGVYPTGAFTKLRYSPGAATVALDRARYAAWWAGLAHVAELLRVMGLATIEISGPAAPKSPWIDPEPEAIARPLHDNLLPPAEEQLVESEDPAAPSGAHAVLAARTVVLAGRRGLGRRQRPRRASEVRHIDPATWKAPAERA